MLSMFQTPAVVPKKWRTTVHSVHLCQKFNVMDVHEERGNRSVESGCLAIFWLNMIQFLFLPKPLNSVVGTYWAYGWTVCVCWSIFCKNIAYKKCGQQKDGQWMSRLQHRKVCYHTNWEFCINMDACIQRDVLMFSFFIVKTDHPQNVFSIDFMGPKLISFNEEVQWRLNSIDFFSSLVPFKLHLMCQVT